MAKRKYQRSHIAFPHPEHTPLASRGNYNLALPCVGGLWKNKDGVLHEVVISEYEPQLNNIPGQKPRVKFYPLPSKWISWDELHKDYCYVGKGSITMRDEVSKLEGDK